MSWQTTSQHFQLRVAGLILPITSLLESPRLVATPFLKVMCFLVLQTKLVEKSKEVREIGNLMKNGFVESVAIRWDDIPLNNKKAVLETSMYFVES